MQDFGSAGISALLEIVLDGAVLNSARELVGV
jgi:hypothetical protein